MFYAKNHKQAHIFDPWAQETKVVRQVMVCLFQQKILPTLSVEALRKHYPDWNGRFFQG